MATERQKAAGQLVADFGDEELEHSAIPDLVADRLDGLVQAAKRSTAPAD